MSERRTLGMLRLRTLSLTATSLFALACAAGAESSSNDDGTGEPAEAAGSAATGPTSQGGGGAAPATSNGGAPGAMGGSASTAGGGSAVGSPPTAGAGGGMAGGGMAGSAGGTASLPPGPTGTGSLSCDGSAVGVTIASAADLEILGDWTIEMWFKDDEAWCHTWRFLVRKGDEFNDPYFIATEDCGVRLGQKSNWNYFTQLENLQQAGYRPGWLHVAATYKSAQHLGQIYVNGEPKFATEQAMNGAPTALGKPVTMCNAFKGKLDDIRLWNVVRSAADIKTNYVGQLKAFPPELVANWTFDNDTNGTVVHDVTSHHHDGVLQKSATISTEVHP